ncbi:MAG: hypothetical protein K2J95_00560 [Lachnospiraceae bacterium]|nr:hypothetical protein [Lachnospiraceae bacterium]
MSAQAEIKSVDFLSYGQKVDQGLQNLLDHNQYITEHFIKNMEMHTEKMRGLGEEFRRLTDLITYSGEGVPLKGIAFSAVSNAEDENTDGEEEKDPVHRTEDMLCGGAEEVFEINTEEVMIKSGAIILSNYMIAYGLGDKYEINKFIKWISVRRPDLLQQLCAANLSSAEEAEQVLDEIFNEIAVAKKEQEIVSTYMDIYDKYRMNMAIKILEEYLTIIKNGEFEEYENFKEFEEFGDPKTWIRIEEVLQRRCPKYLINLYQTQGEEGRAGVFVQLMRIYVKYRLDIMIDDVKSLNMGEDMNPTQQETFVACWNRLVGMGLSETHIIAVMANIFLESRCSAPNAYYKIYPDLDDSDVYDFDPYDEIAFGIIQWLWWERKEALSDYADRSNGDVFDLETQLGYFEYEMTDPKGACYNLWPDFLATTNLDEAVETFCCDIERAGDSSLAQRQEYADIIETWYDNLNN